MGKYVALYDACVLYPAPLRDLLMHLAGTGLFRARWTDDIHEEWIRNVLARHPDLTAGQLARVRSLMDAHVPDALVTGYRPLIDSLDLPDPDDRHVLAAAIRAGAGVIVTFNVSDFPGDRLAPFGVEAQHPDDFVLHLSDLDPAAVCRAARDHRGSLKRPTKTVDEYLDALRAAGLSKTVSFLREHAHLI